MKLIRYFRFSLLSIINVVLLSACGLLVFVVLQILTYNQSDNQQKVTSKQSYLQSLQQNTTPAENRPNIIFILYDDMGYGDIGAGVPKSGLINTPNLDTLAANGVSLTNFYSPAPVCTPSRAGFLTGRLPLRAGLPYVVFPSDSATGLLANRVATPNYNERLPAEEITIAEILSAAGYRTGMVGKWHLGDVYPSLPNDFGFDAFFGALYSNDMKPFAFYRNTQIEAAAPVDQRYMSERYSAEVVKFIEQASEQPFFLYLAHNFPHDPLFVRDERRGSSDAGLYGDVVEELDDGIGELIAALERSDQLNNTLIVITSDNGPWFLGNTGGGRMRKGSTFDGGMKVPFIAHWPAMIPGGRVESSIAMGIDLVPTILEILHLPAPQDRLIDGKSIKNMLANGAPTPHDYLYLYDGATLFSVRDNRFKYRPAKPVHYGTDETIVLMPVPQKEWLFDMHSDPAETYDVSERYPDVLNRMRRAYQSKLASMEENTRGWL